jgi:hypothetical protein
LSDLLLESSMVGLLGFDLGLEVLNDLAELSRDRESVSECR